MTINLSRYEPDPVFMRAVSEMSEFGFKFAASHQDGVMVGSEYSPSTPSVVMVSDPTVMSSTLPNAIACMYEDAPFASYLFFALDAKNTSKKDLEQLGELGGFFFPEGDAKHGSTPDVLYGFVPMKTNSCSADNYGPSYEKDLAGLMMQLSDLKLKTVPYPCTSPSLGLLPMFADYAFEPLSAKQAVPILSKYFSNSLNMLKMQDSLQSLVVEHNLNTRKHGFSAPSPRAMRA